MSEINLKRPLNIRNLRIALVDCAKCLCKMSVFWKKYLERSSHIIFERKFKMLFKIRYFKICQHAFLCMCGLLSYEAVCWLCEGRTVNTIQVMPSNNAMPNYICLLYLLLDSSRTKILFLRSLI